YDWRAICPERILAHVDQGLARARRRHKGANILLHDGHQRGIGADRRATVQATEELLQRFHRDGLRTVTVDAWG
ncbi:MAG: polysaccharide deacetylase family protein, partial [Acidobacteriaceae bacterium]